MKRAWYLGAFAAVLLVVVAIASLLESKAPAANSISTIEPSMRAQPVPGPSGPTKTVPATTPPAAYTFPVVAASATYARTHHDYPAADIIAPCNSRVLAVTGGTILEVSRKDAYNANTDDGATRGGLFVSLLGDDGVRYYGSHFRSIPAGIEAGVRVRRGDQLGVVGDSGDASVCHLHFGISPPCAQVGDWWIRRGVLWPATYLDAWRQGTAMSPVAEIADWTAKHGCPGAP